MYQAILVPLGIVAVITSAYYVNIQIVGKEIGRLKSDAIIMFVISMGQLGKKQIVLLKKRCALDEAAARIFIKYQWFCLLEMMAGVVLLFTIASTATKIYQNVR